MAKPSYTTKAGNHQDFDYAGSTPAAHTGAMKLPVVDDVKGAGPAPTPDDVKGNSGALQSADEARNL